MVHQDSLVVNFHGFEARNLLADISGDLVQVRGCRLSSTDLNSRYDSSVLRGKVGFRCRPGDRGSAQRKEKQRQAKPTQGPAGPNSANHAPRRDHAQGECKAIDRDAVADDHHHRWPITGKGRHDLADNRSQQKNPSLKHE